MKAKGARTSDRAARVREGLEEDLATVSAQHRRSRDAEWAARTELERARATVNELAAKIGLYERSIQNQRSQVGLPRSLPRHPPALMSGM
eukprot:scaffold1558_cov403-Prasinococcus_capsulatus_cf.AAC.20